MAEEKMMRLSQAARKLNVGTSTIIDHLASKGFDIDSNPNSKITQEQYAMLAKEYADSAHEKEEASGLQIGAKHKQNVVIDGHQEEKKKEDEEEKIFIKNMSIDSEEEAEEETPAASDSNSKSEEEAVKTEAPKLQGIKVLGKIDLDKSGKTEESEEKPKEEKPEEKAKKEETPVAKKEEKEKPQEKETPKQEAPKQEVKKPVEKPVEPKVKAEEKKEETPKKETPPVEKKKEPIAKKEEAKTTAPKEEKPKSSEPEVKQEKEKMKAQPAAEAPKKAKESPEPAKAEKKNDGVIEAKADKLKGLKVVGKIELPVVKKSKPVASSDQNKDNKKKKRPRKRIQKDGGNSGPGNASGQGSGGPGQHNRGGDNRNRRGPGQGGQNRPNQGGKRKRPVAVQKEEPTDKEIQEQIKQTLAKLSGGKKKQTGAKYRREKRSAIAEAEEKRLKQEQEDSKILKVTEYVSVSDLASLMSVSVNDVISTCMSMGLFVSINQRLDAESITIIADEFNYNVEFASSEEEEVIVEEVEEETNLESRAPIVTIMGHVDHGKTSLLDFIRSSKVTDTEAGGITQHIGAYDVMTESGQKIAFLDTPGHEAFTAMRARGAKLTDVVIIVVAADDDVMPQTKEAINHAQVADVPIVIAINKIDRPNANPEKIKEALAQQNVLVEDWGGKYQCQEISAKTGQGIDELLEKVILEAEILDLKANFKKKAVGTVVEASLDKGRGYVSTVLVQSGTLNIGDIILAGSYYGRVKAMFNHKSEMLKDAGPSTPVLLLGLDGAPQAGDKFNVMESDREAREIAAKRQQIQREQSIRTKKHITLDEIGRRLAIGNFKELNVIVKGDVDGSIEALSDSLLKLSTDEIQVNILHKGVGQISESDVLLASASDAVIVGFQVRPSQQAKRIAENEEIEIRLYSIIYDAINDVKDAMEGMLAPEFEEVIVGNLEVREIFKISRIGTVAGCMVTDGYMKRTNPIRLIRDGIVVYSGELGQLKRFKEDVQEVKQNFECGMSIKNFNDIKPGDVVESYEQREIKRKL